METLSSVPPGARVQPPPPQPQAAAVQQPLQQAPLVCPRCRAEAAPGPGPQACGSCGGSFALYLGAVMDPSRQIPAPIPTRVKVKAAGLVTYRLGVVEEHGVASGETDPLLGMIPLDKSGVAWGDVLTVSVWRKIDVKGLVLALIVPVPLALFGVVAAFGSLVVGFALVLPFGLIAAWMLYLAVGIRANWLRVAGRYRTIEIRFDRPLRRRKKFHDQLLHRAGLPPAPIP